MNRTEKIQTAGLIVSAIILLGFLWVGERSQTEVYYNPNLKGTYYEQTK